MPGRSGLPRATALLIGAVLFVPLACASPRPTTPSPATLIGRPLGDRIDPLVPWEYVRDPAGEFAAKRWLRGSYDGDAALSQTAAYTGWTNGNIELWIDPAQLDDGIFIVHGGVVERWGRAAEQWGVTDCN